MKNIRPFVLTCCILFSSCEQEDVFQVDFTIANTLLRPYYDELIIENNSDDDLQYQWYLNDDYLSNYLDVKEPKLRVSTSGEYTLKLVATTNSGGTQSIERKFRVGSYSIDKIIIKNIQGLEGKIWDSDSIGNGQLPDLFLAREINQLVLYEGQVYWNISNEKLPLEINVPESFVYSTKDVNTIEFVFFDKDLGANEYMSSKTGESYTDYHYDEVTKQGGFTVYQDSGIKYDLYYTII